MPRVIQIKYTTSKTYLFHQLGDSQVMDEGKGSIYSAAILPPILIESGAGYLLKRTVNSWSVLGTCQLNDTNTHHLSVFCRDKFLRGVFDFDFLPKLINLTLTIRVDHDVMKDDGSTRLG